MYAGAFYLCLVVLPWGTPFLPLLALPAIVHAGIRRFLQNGLRDIPVGLLIAPLLLLLILNGTLKGAIQLAACMSSLYAFKFLGELEHFRNRIARLQLLTMAAALVLLPFALILPEKPTVPFSFFFVPGDHGGVRFRFLFAEPNHFAFFFYFLALYAWKSLSAERLSLSLTVAASLLIAAATGSPLAYLGTLMIFSLLLLQSSQRIRFASVTFLVVFAVALVAAAPKNLEARVGLLLEGEDNSFNLRTWGALAIAEAINIENGTTLTGVGFGRGREVLEDNPYMAAFAASNESVLPSLAGAALLETGYLGLGAILTLMLLAAWRSRRCGSMFFSALLTLLHAASGSFLFDTFMWTAIGLLLSRIADRDLEKVA